MCPFNFAILVITRPNSIHYTPKTSRDVRLQWDARANMNHYIDFVFVTFRQSVLFLCERCRKLWRAIEERCRNDSLFVDDKDAVVLRRNACDWMLAGHLPLIVTVGENTRNVEMLERCSLQTLWQQTAVLNMQKKKRFASSPAGKIQSLRWCKTG